MKDRLVATKHHQRQGNISKLLTSEMRQHIHELRLRLDGCDYRLFAHLNNIQEALDIARQSARCLLTSDPFGTWEGIRREDELDILGKPAAENQLASRNRLAKAKVEKLTTAQMRLQIVEATKRLEEYASCLDIFFDDLKKLSTFHTALELTDDLQEREPLETREMRKKREEEEDEDEDEDDDWSP